MSRLAEDVVTVHASPDRIWAVLEDADALGRVLPGCESIEAEGPGRYRGVLASRIGFMTVRADVVATLQDLQRPAHALLQLEGRPRMLAGSFVASVPFDLTPEGDATRVSYAVDLSVTGRLATFGQPLLRATLKGQLTELVAGLEREVGRPAEADGSA